MLTIVCSGWAKAGWAVFATWNCGAALFVEDDRRPFDPIHLLDTLHKYPITTLCAPPTAYRQLVLQASLNHFRKNPPAALEHCVGAGEPLNGEVIRLWKEMSGIQICDGYGQTETILVCGNLEGNAIKVGSMGKPVPGVPMLVVDESGQEVPSGTEGNIALSIGDDTNPPFFGIFEGYIKEDGSVQRPVTASTAGKTLFLTGDRATRDTDGYFWFVGRSDDIINSSGYRIGKFQHSPFTLHTRTPDSNPNRTIRSRICPQAASGSSRVGRSGFTRSRACRGRQSFHRPH